MPLHWTSGLPTRHLHSLWLGPARMGLHCLTPQDSAWSSRYAEFVCGVVCLIALVNCQFFQLGLVKLATVCKQAGWNQYRSKVLPLQDQYIELTSKVPATSAFFGLGERTPSSGLQLLREGIPLALWNRDNPAADPDENIYGSHPNYLELRPGMCVLCSHHRVAACVQSL